jgi:hypothetical protein
MNGYPKLAAFMSDKRHAILRKYEHLAVQDLLLQQPQICQLEYEFELAAKKDASQEDDRQYYSRHWLYLNGSEERNDSDQLVLAMEIRQRLRDYCKPFRLSPVTRSVHTVWIFLQLLTCC